METAIYTACLVFSVIQRSCDDYAAQLLIKKITDCFGLLLKKKKKKKTNKQWEITTMEQLHWGITKEYLRIGESLWYYRLTSL